MFKTVSTSEKVELVKSIFSKKGWLNNAYWLVFNHLDNSYGWVEDNSKNSNGFPEIKEVNQEILTQLRLLHSLGFTPKEIAEIING